jgi:hypothetical protein
MTATSPSAPPSPPSRAAAGSFPGRGAVTARVGLIIAALLGIGDIVLGASQLRSDQTIPPTISMSIIAAGVVTLIALPFAWRGVAWATWLIVVARLLSALSAVPALLMPAVPSGLVAGAAIEIMLAVLVAVLLLLRPRRSV